MNQSTVSSLAEPSGFERRRDERRTVHWEVEGQWACKKRFTALAINVSKSGLRMFTARSLPVGNTGYIRVNTFLGGKPHCMVAEVEVMNSELSNNKFSCGVKFTKISELNAVYIKAFVMGKNPHLAMARVAERKNQKLVFDKTNDDFDNEKIIII
jgi:hypothetical protein